MKDKGFKSPFDNAVMPKHDFSERPTNGTDPTACVDDTDEDFGRVSPKSLPENTLKFDQKGK